jgi:hypothetical protein
MHFQKFLASQPNCFIGICLATDCKRDAKGSPRYEIAVSTPGDEIRSRRLIALEGLRIEPRDKVLVTSPINSKEAVIIGVLERKNESRQESPAVIHSESPSCEHQEVVTARHGGSIRIVREDGRPLIDICDGENGPIIRLCGDDAQLDVPGHLRIAADKLDLTSRRGDVRIRADEDVVVEGDIIRLN